MRSSKRAILKRSTKKTFANHYFCLRQVTLAGRSIMFSTCKGKGKGLDTCYSATYMSQTRHQQRFTISEVAADWHKPIVPQRIMWPFIARANGQLDPRCS